MGEEFFCCILFWKNTHLSRSSGRDGWLRHRLLCWDTKKSICYHTLPSLKLIMTDSLHRNETGRRGPCSQAVYTPIIQIIDFCVHIWSILKTMTIYPHNMTRQTQSENWITKTLSEIWVVSSSLVEKLESAKRLNFNNMSFVSSI